MTLIRLLRRRAGSSSRPRSLVARQEVPLVSRKCRDRRDRHQGRTLERAEQRAGPCRRASPHQRRGRARRGRTNRCSTTFFSKTREMRFLTRCRRRQRGLYADGAPHKGLREVDEARSSGLHASKVAGSHPDNFGFWRKMLYILEKNVVFFGWAWLSRNGKAETLIWRKMLYQNVRCDFEAFRSSNAAKSPFCD